MTKKFFHPPACIKEPAPSGTPPFFSLRAHTPASAASKKSVSSALPAQETGHAAPTPARRRTTRLRTARQSPRHTRPLPPRQARPRARRSRHGCGPAPPPARRERFERPSGARNGTCCTHPRAPPGPAPAPAVGRFGGAARPRSLNRRGGRWPRPPLVSLPRKYRRSARWPRAALVFAHAFRSLWAFGPSAHRAHASFRRTFGSLWSLRPKCPGCSIIRASLTVALMVSLPRFGSLCASRKCPPGTRFPSRHRAHASLRACRGLGQSPKAFVRARRRSQRGRSRSTRRRAGASPAA